MNSHNLEKAIIKDTWYRSGNFYRDRITVIKFPNRVYHFPLVNHVAFLNYDRFSFMKSISVSRYMDSRDVEVKLHSVYMSGDVLLQACKKFFEDTVIQSNERGNQCTIRLRSLILKDTENLLNLLKFLNVEKFLREDISNNVQDEVKKILTYIYLKVVEAYHFSDLKWQKELSIIFSVLDLKHSIEELPALKDLTPSTSTDISQVFYSYSGKRLDNDKLDPKDIKQYLPTVDIADINTPHADGGTPLLYATSSKQHTDVIRYLLAYHADPAARGQGTRFKSALEEAMEGNNPETYNLLLTHYQKLHKPLTQPSQKQLYSISDFKMGMDANNRLQTNLYTHDDQIIQFQLFETNQLTSSENTEVYHLYTKFFTPSKVMRKVPGAKGKELEKFYEHEFEGVDYPSKKTYRFIETVKLFDKNKDNKKNVSSILGVNLYEIFEEKNSIVAHISGIFFEENIRGRGLTDPLVLTIPHALTKLFSNKTVLCVYQPIVYGSARIVMRDLVTFPQYYTDEFAELAKRILARIQRNPDPKKEDESPPFVCEPGSGYSEIEVFVRQDNGEYGKVKIRSDCFLFLFESLRDNLQKLLENEHRGLLLITPMGDQSWKKYNAGCSAMKLNAHTYVNCFAMFFEKFISGLRPSIDTQKTYLHKSNARFFRGSLEPSETFIDAPDMKVLPKHIIA